MIGAHSGNSAPFSDTDIILCHSLPCMLGRGACHASLPSASNACHSCLSLLFAGTAQPAVTDFSHYTACNTVFKCAHQQLALRKDATQLILIMQLSLSLPLQPATAACHCSLSQLPVTAACRCSLPLLPAAAACHCCLMLLPVHCYQPFLPLPSNWLLVTAAWLPQTTMAFANYSTIQW
jgi:hypothetical protein